MTKFGVYSDMVEMSIAECLEQDWVSDERYCAAYIRDQILKRNGPWKIYNKLLEKGVEKELAKEKVDQVYTEGQREEIKTYLEEKKREEIRKKKPKISEFELDGKVKQYLRGKGF